MSLEEHQQEGQHPLTGQRRQFQAIFPVITGSCPTNVIARLHGLSMDLTVGRTEVQLLIRQLVELLDWQSNCVNIGLTVDPNIDPTVKITGQPVSLTQASDGSGRLPRYEANCVQRTHFQWRVGPFAFLYQGNGATPCPYIDTTRKAIDCATICRWQFLYNGTLQQTSRTLLSKLYERRQI